ncbi:MAG: thiamine pyrophosphate-binding protein [Lautropia sp.]
MTRLTGSRQLAEMLRAYSVDHVFFVPAILMQALAEMERVGIRRVMTHSEIAAAYMADGYGRASGKPGFCMAQNVGGSNLAAGLRDARMGCSPVIAITGGPSVATRYRNQYQEVDHFGQFDPVTKFNAVVENVARLPDLVRQAFREATGGAPGPVHLQMGSNLGELAEGEAAGGVQVQPEYCRAPSVRTPAAQDQIDAAIHRLLSAKRPVLVAGGGVATSGARAEVVELAERLGMPVATSLNGKGTIPDGHPLALGVVGAYARECANRVVSMADLVVFVGSRTGSQVTNGWSVPAQASSIVHIDIDSREPGRNYPDTCAVVGDARSVVRQLIAALGRRAAVPVNGDWAEQARRLVAEWRESERAAAMSAAEPIRPERLCRAISEALPDDAVLVADTGHSGLWSGPLIDLVRPGQRYIRCAGSLGWSFPAALGVKCALPQRTVVCFNGDGAFYYHMAELETAARHGINVVVVVNNNSAFNQEIRLVNEAYDGIPGQRQHDLWKFRDVNFAAIAESLGCVGMRVTAPEQLSATLTRAIDAGRPVVVDVVTDVRAMAKRAWKPGASPAP